ncbi:tetraspanin 97E isoform X2 [Arctopsyche grandis]|uniref:tetraspanin 97E isoform X2 n=1 Tax=Arctopsyche grandis TaxID=121162 RepID=UPI00406D941F
MCGGFTCSKNALVLLNGVYVVVAFILIGVAVYGRAASIVTNLPIIGGILACGILLILISMLGLAGALKHHQVMLFFYMVILFMLFLIQFSVACACLAVNNDQQEGFAQHGWTTVNPEIKTKVQETFLCCGFLDRNITNGTMGHPPCDSVNHLCSASGCPPCMEKLQATINHAFKLCGSIGLFFSFTEFVGVWLTIRYRNQKDPRANPSAFL